MNVVVLFDEAGDVGAILHPAFKAGKKEGSEDQVGGFIPQDGQHSAILEVPPELQHLELRELHNSVRVEVIGGSPRLIPRERSDDG